MDLITFNMAAFDFKGSCGGVSNGFWTFFLISTGDEREENQMSGT